MIDETAIARRYHDLYCSLTSRPLKLLMSHIQEWNEFRANGWTEDDLRLAVKLLKDKIRKGQKWDTCLNFRNLLREDNFAEYLAEAKAIGRAPKPDPARTVLKATNRPDRVSINEAKTAKQVMSESGLAALQAFKDLKASL